MVDFPKYYCFRVFMPFVFGIYFYTPSYYEHGRGALRIIGIIMSDRLEKQVEALKQQIEFILGATHTGLDIIDTEFNIRYIDPEWQKKYGDPAGRKCYEYFMGRSDICPGCGVVKAFETKQPVVTEEILVCENNRVIQVTTIPYQDENGEWLAAEVNADITELKRAEDAIRESEEKLRGMFNSAADAIAVADLNAVLTDVNDAAVRMHGVKDKSELVGLNSLMFVKKEELGKAQWAIQEVLEKGYISNIESVFLRKNGMVEFPIEISTSLLRDKEGRPNGFVSIIKDITERKKAEAERREIETRFKETADLLPSIIAEADVDLKLRYTNKFGQEAFGITEADIAAGVSILDLIHPSERKRAATVIPQIMKGEKPTPREYKLLRKDGSEFYALINAAAIREGGEPAGIRVSMADVTEAKVAEEAIRDYSAFQSVLATVRGFAPEASEADIWKALLTILIEIYGFRVAWYGEYKDGIVTPTVYIGFGNIATKNIKLDISKPDGPFASSAIGRAINSEKPFSYSDLIENNTSDIQHKYYVELGLRSNLAIPVAVEGRIEGGVVIFAETIDAFPQERIERFSLLVREIGAIIGERRKQRRTEEEKEALRMQLAHAQKMEAIGTLAGGMAHDFNNILAVIMGSADTALAKIPEDDPNHARIKRILNSSRRARELTMKLLTFARKEKLDVRPIHVSDVINELVDILKRILPKNVRIDTKLHETASLVKADANQLQQALLNICMNAADAMPDGGTLSIESSLIVPDEGLLKKIQGLEPQRYSHIRIADTGAGMPQDILDRVFEPFFTTKEKGKGTGLGLPITLGIIRNHGGVIHITSAPGGGSSVDVFLPVAPAGTISTKSETAETPRTNNETILLVDDDPDYLEVVSETLQIEGFHLLSADSGKKAIETYEKHGREIDLVLLDVRMPDTDGAEVFSALRLIDPAVKVIFCTGHSFDSHIARIGESDSAHFLQKPFGIDDLRRKIREIIDA